MKRFVFILFLTGMVFISVNSQTITVRDTVNGRVLELVTLTSEHPHVSTVTNARGQADFSPFRGADKIEVRLLGYKPKLVSYAEAEDQDFNIWLNESGVSLDEVVVSATRWNQSKKEVPNHIAGISPADVLLNNPQTSADLLGSSGEVFIQKSQLGGGSLMIRGFATNRLLIAVDGIRMNTAIFRSGNLQNVISVNPFVLEKAEVVFGPGSVIYGSDAIAGAMCFNTLNPQLSFDGEHIVSGKAITRFSSANNERTGHLDINTGWKKWALVSGFTYSDFGDLRMGSRGPEEYLRPFYVKRIDNNDVVMENEDKLVQNPTGFKQVNMMQKIYFKPDNHWDIIYGFHYSTTSDYARYDRLIRTRNGLPRSAEWYYGPQEWMMNNLIITHNANYALYDRMSTRVAWQKFEESRIDRDMNDAERRHRTEKVDAFSANIDFIKNAGLRHKLVYGIEAVYDDVQSSGTDEDIETGISTAGPSRYPASTWKSYATYLSWQFRAGSQFLLQSGARYNLFALDAVFDTAFYPFPFTTANINEGALTGSLGMIYTPTENWTVSVNIATGFRSPNVDDMGKVFDSEPGSVVVPNPALKAEYAYNAEAGIARVFGETVKIDLTGYYTILDNALVRRDFFLNGQDSLMYDGELSRVQAVQNAAKAYVYGMQAGIEIKMFNGWGFLSRFNYQKGEEELDNGSKSPLRHAAPWFGVSHLSYSGKDLKLDWYLEYCGEVSYKNMPEEERGKDYMYAVDDNGNPYSPGWYTLNFKAQYKVSDHIILNGGVENITDRRYRPYSSGLTAPGRNFIFSLQVVY